MSERPGYAQLPMSLRDWEWIGDLETLGMLSYLLLRANFKDAPFRGRIIKRGQAVVGRKELATELRLSERRVRTLLGRLKATSKVTIETTNQFSLITIVNYGSYINSWGTNDQQSDQQNANDRPTTDQPATSDRPHPNKNNNNNKNKKNNIIPPPVSKEDEPRPWPEAPSYLMLSTNEELTLQERWSEGVVTAALFEIYEWLKAGDTPTAIKARSRASHFRTANNWIKSNVERAGTLDRIDTSKELGL